MIENQPQVSAEFEPIIEAASLEGLKKMIEAKVYKMAAKLKKNNKQVNESVIKREDFLEVLQEINPNYG